MSASTGSGLGGRKLAILGLGLMGGSLGLAAKRRSVFARVSGYARSEESRRLALAAGAVDEVHADPAAAVAGADIVVVCVPVLATRDIVSRCLGALGPGCIITDVGSTKESVTAAMREALGALFPRFVGSHPIAGSEATGMAAAQPGLYEGSVVVVTPTAESAPECARDVGAMWEAVGGRVVLMDSGAHDRILARTSHVPHLVAAALAQSVLGGEAGAAAKPYCGSGFRDTTRIAAGSEEMWHDIIATNRDAILREMERFGDTIRTLTDLIASGRDAEVREFLREARTLRGGLGRQPGNLRGACE